MHKFSTSSKQRIAEVHELLQRLANETIKASPFDFGVLKNGGLRTAEEQKELYDKGYSRCDGYAIKSYHQSGLALDFVPYVNGAFTWKNKDAFLGIATTVFEVWENTPDKQGMFLHWGGYWGAVDLDLDGKLEKDDKLGWDLPHYELRPYAQHRGVYPVVWNTG